MLSVLCVSVLPCDGELVSPQPWMDKLDGWFSTSQHLWILEHKEGFYQILGTTEERGVDV